MKLVNPSHPSIGEFSMSVFSYFKGIVRRSTILLGYHFFGVDLQLRKQKVAERSFVRAARDVFVPHFNHYAHAIIMHGSHRDIAVF